LFTLGNLTRGRNIPLWPVALVIGYLVLAPLAILLWSSLRTVPPGEAGALTLANYVNAYLDTETHEIFINTIIFAGGSSLLAVTFGFMLAWLVERTDIPLKNLFYGLAIVPTAIPSMIFAISWIFILAPRIGFLNLILRKLLLLGGLPLTEGPLTIYSMGGMILVEGLRLTSTSFLLQAGLLRNMDPSLEDAAGMSGASTLSTLRHITMPLLFPGILTTAIYVLITSIAIFGVPGILGMPAKIYVFSTQIYLATHPMQGGTPNYGMASTYGIILMTLSALLLYIYYKTTAESERFVTISGKGYRPKVIELGKARYFLLALVIVYYVLTIGLPLFSLVWSSLQPFYAVPSLQSLARVSLKGYQRTFNYPNFLPALKNTFLTILCVPIITMFLSTIASWMLVRGRSRYARLLDIICFVPHTIPGIVLSLALMWTYLQIDFIPIYGTLWIIIIAFVTKDLAYGTRATNTAMLQISKELEEAAAMAGAKRHTILARVTIPLLIPAMANAMLHMAARCFSDISIALMLYTSGSVLLSTLIWTMWEGGKLAEASAMGILMFITMLLFSSLSRFFTEKK
jgi:iron(III) transport system permease protein